MSDCRVHFIGIGGIGMSGIAHLLVARGVAVSGSDCKESANTRALAAAGCEIFIGHAAENVACATEVVISTAIRQENPELVAARARGLKITHRASKLAELVNAARGITVAGTHGKTTTSSMCATVLRGGGLNPSFVIGGIVNTFATNAGQGSSDLFVIEADESDGTLVEFRPEVAVLTNVELDHMDFYRDQAHVDEVFSSYIGHIKPGGYLVWCHDDAGARRVVDAIRLHCESISYGLNPGARLQAANPRHDGLCSYYDAVLDGERLGEVKVCVPGLHNVQNSLAALAVGLRSGLSFEAAAAALAEFVGVQRRFQIVGRSDDYTVVDDYAHHPSEIAATLSAARGSDAKRIISIFQPHRYSRTASLAEEFGRAFGHADEVVITDIYGAGEDPIPDVTGNMIVESIRSNNHPNVLFVSGLDEVEAHVASRMQPNDMVITLGAGDIWKVAKQLSGRLAALGAVPAPAAV